MQKVTAFKATDGSLHETQEQALYASIVTFLRAKVREYVNDPYCTLIAEDVYEYLGDNAQEFIDFYNQHKLVE